MIVKSVVSTSDHGSLGGLGDDDHTQYLLINGTRDMTGNLLPNATGTLDIGDSTDHWRTIYLDNNGGNVAVCKTAQVSGGPATHYTFNCGGGQYGSDQNQGGTFTFKMNSIGVSLGTSVNQIIFDVGQPDLFAAGTTNDVIFQAYNGIATYGFVSSFGGWNDVEYGLELRRITGTEAAGKTLIFDNQIPVSDFRRSIDFRINSVNKMTIENTGYIHIVDALTFDANALFSGTFAIGPAGTKSINLSTSTFIVDWLYIQSATTNTGTVTQVKPNGTSTQTVSMLLNSSTAAWGIFETYITGTTAAINVAGYSGGTAPTVLNIGETTGWLAAWTTGALTTIDFYFNNVIECQIQPNTLVFNNGATDTQLDWATNGELGLQVATNDIIRLTATQIQAIQDIVISDAQNIIINTTTGTKIGTGTTQKLAFYNSTPIIQPSSTGETVGFTAGTGTGVNDDSTFTGNVGATAYRISDIVKHLKNLGLIAA